MTQRTYAPPLDSIPGPRPLIVNKTPCRTGLFLALILLGTAVLTVDRYLTNDAVRRVEDIEAYNAREMAQIKAADDAQIRMMYSIQVNNVLAGQMKLLQERLDGLTMQSVELLKENLILRTTLEAVAEPAGAYPFQGPVVTPPTTPTQDKDA